MRLPYILIVDDDPDDLFVFEKAFAAAYPEVEIVILADGDQVLPYLDTQQGILPNVILLDYKMPRMSGAEVLRQLAQSLQYQAIPKAVWTTSGREIEMRECLQLGAACIFVKPQSDQDLSQIIAKMGDLIGMNTTSRTI